MTAAIFGPEGPKITAWEQAFFRETQPLGFILFARNIDTPDQLRRLTHSLRESVQRDAPILIDQEGGRAIGGNTCQPSIRWRVRAIRCAHNGCATG